MITHTFLAQQERLQAQAFATGDLGHVRHLYHHDVTYRSPTVRLFDWPAHIQGVDDTLEFIGVTIQSCRDIEYEAIEFAIVEGSETAFVRIHFDWNHGDQRLRSNYLVVYRYRDDLIAEQEIYYDPSAAPEVLTRPPSHRPRSTQRP